MNLVGNRPHFIKAAKFSTLINNHEDLDQILVHSGQHYDKNLSDIFFRELGLPQPDYNLKTGSMRPALQVAKMVEKLDLVIEKEKPDLIVVYGDTNTTAAGAIAAAKTLTPLAHIEAGLREKDMTIPEEMNKLLTDAVSSLLFCPTPTAVDHLVAEGKTKGVHLVGDIGLDLVSDMQELIRSNKKILAEYNLAPGSYYFMTCHRQRNTESEAHLFNILNAVSELSLPVIFPIHPRTKASIERYQLNNSLGQNIVLIDPLGFLETQVLIKNAKVVITDSGGVIKESYFHKTPCVIIDKQTEWVETTNEGWSVIAGPNKLNILSSVNNFKVPTKHLQSLGSGKASKLIVEKILNYLYNTDLN